MTPGTQTRMAAWLESAWLARYLDRQLEGEELAWFEAYLLDKPELVEAVEVDNQLRDSVGASGTTHFAGSNAPGQLWPVRHPSTAARLRWAAGCAIAGFAIGLFGSRMISRDTTSLVANPTRIVIDSTRGSAASNSLTTADFPTSNSNFVIVEISMPPGAEDISIGHAGVIVPVEVSRDGFASFLLSRESFRDQPMVTLNYAQHGRRISRDVRLDSKEEIP